jgi:hypothetical protein
MAYKHKVWKEKEMKGHQIKGMLSQSPHSSDTRVTWAGEEREGESRTVGGRIRIS